LPFFKILSEKLFVEFLTFDTWNCLRVTENDVYRRWLPTSSIYRVKKGIIKFWLFPPTSPLQTALSLGPFKIDKKSNAHPFNHF